MGVEWKAEPLRLGCCHERPWLRDGWSRVSKQPHILTVTDHSSVTLGSKERESVQPTCLPWPQGTWPSQQPESCSTCWPACLPAKARVPITSKLSGPRLWLPQDPSACPHQHFVCTCASWLCPMLSARSCQAAVASLAAVPSADLPGTPGHPSPCTTTFQPPPARMTAHPAACHKPDCGALGTMESHFLERGNNSSTHLPRLRTPTWAVHFCLAWSPSHAEPLSQWEMQILRQFRASFPCSHPILVLRNGDPG